MISQEQVKVEIQQSTSQGPESASFQHEGDQCQFCAFTLDWPMMELHHLIADLIGKLQTFL